MPKTPLSTDLKAWLNHTVYPHLTHDQVFGTLLNYTKAEYSETRYSDCPRCHHAKSFYMPANRPTGNCNHCGCTIAWWAFLHFDHSESEAIATIAGLAGVDPFTPSLPIPPSEPYIRFDA